jgi:uncharacterized protein
MKTVQAQPVQERIIALDILRGFALLGVLLVNMLDFSGSALRLNTLGARGNTLDQIVDVAIAFFAITKFYLLFSFLFGVGFAVQMRRLETTERSPVAFTLRRMGVLLMIGLAHAILIWDGDILRLYAAAGALLLLVRRLPDRALIALALIVALAGLIYFSTVDLSDASDLMDTESVQLYLSGTYPDLVRHRVAQPIILDLQIPMVLAMFLIGLVVGRGGWLDRPDRYAPLLRRWWKWALPVGLIGNAVMLAGYESNSAWAISLGVHIGAPALSLVYASAVLLNADKLRGLAPVGQMALTNYLSQSLIGTTLFYSYGFGLYDRLAPTVTLVLVAAIFGAQVVVSAWWMGRFRFGLMEWLWRTLTYGRFQPIKRAAPVAAQMGS